MTEEERYLRQLKKRVLKLESKADNIHPNDLTSASFWQKLWGVFKLELLSVLLILACIFGYEFLVYALTNR